MISEVTREELLVMITCQKSFTNFDELPLPKKARGRIYFRLSIDSVAIVPIFPFLSSENKRIHIIALLHYV